MNAIELRLRIYEALADSSPTKTVTAQDVADLIGPPTANARSVGHALKALGFEQIKPQRNGRKFYCFCYSSEPSKTITKKDRSKRVIEGQANAAEWFQTHTGRPRGIQKWKLGHEGNGCGSKQEPVPAIWRRPARWPAIIETQQRLKDMHVPSAAIDRHSRAAVVDDYLQRALEDLMVNHGSGSAKKRGMLAAQIRETIETFYNDSISLKDLAVMIGEKHDADRAAVLNRVQGLVRFNDRSISIEDLAKALKARPGSSKKALLTKIEVLVG